jgi:hypothetical protein
MMTRPATSEENSMVRTILGFSVFAVVGVLAMKLLLGLFGGIFSLLVTILIWAFWGWVFYLILKAVAPGTAARLREVISGKPS